MMMREEDLKKLEKEALDSGVTEQIVSYSIAISLRRIADDIAEIKNGMRFICERWKS